MASSKRKIEVTKGTMNIFADLNLPNPDVRLAKVRLSIIVNKMIETQGLTKPEAAKKLGITQPESHRWKNIHSGTFHCSA